MSSINSMSLYSSYFKRDLSNMTCAFYWVLVGSSVCIFCVFTSKHVYAFFKQQEMILYNMAYIVIVNGSGLPCYTQKYPSNKFLRKNKKQT